MTNGVTGVEFQPAIHINLHLTTGEPMSFKIAQDVIKICKDHEIPICNLGIDTTGQQGSLADIVDRLTGEHCRRVQFAAEASSNRVSIEDSRPAKEAYKNKMTEMWYQVREFGRNGQIRGLGFQSAEEFCQRLVSEKLDVRGRIQLESKIDMKNRTGGKSPDDADSAAITMDVIRSVLGIYPGQGTRLSQQDFSPKDVERNMLSDDDLYSEDDVSNELLVGTLDDNIEIMY
jgi:hypothetical protein